MSLSESLGKKCLSLNDELCMVRPTLIDLNPVDYPFIISLSKCSGSFNSLSPKICISKESKYIKVKAYNMITKKMKLKQ